MMWLFLTTTCLICGTLNAGKLFNLEREANPEVWMNTVSHGNSKEHQIKQILGYEFIKSPVRS